MALKRPSWRPTGTVSWSAPKLAFWQPSSSQRATGGGPGGGPAADRRRSRRRAAGTLQTVDGDRRLAAEAGPRAIDELDAIDRAIAADEIERPRAAARADELADAEILWGPVEEDDPEIQELDIVAGDFERDLLEAALAAADADDVAIDAEADLLLAEQLPILALAHLLGVDGEHRAAAEVVARARGDLDPLDRTGASLQVERLRALAGVELLAQVDLLNLVVAEHDRDADDEDGALRRLEADAGKAAVAASHVDRVAIDTDPADARRAEQHPLAPVGIARQAGVARRGAVPIAGPLRGGRVYDCRRQQQQSCKRQDVSAQHSYLPTDP